MRTFVVVLALLAARVAVADDLVDIDGDGDIDDDDRKALEAAELIEVKDKSDATKLTESSRAVTVVDLRRARERGADLGEVMARAHGVAVRRTGGLGSASRFSLNGLYDQQVRFFLDGIPLDLAGFGLGIENVPVELLQRVDVYRGVVPIAFGADALGGGVDLVTDPSWVDRAAISYQVGSFGLHRVSLGARARDASTGLALGLSLFTDRARNDYPVVANVPNAVGTPTPTRVRRFHDGYLAGGAIVEGGIVARGIVERALVRLYETTYDKELQSNPTMTVPYGEATYGGDSRGGTGELALASGPWHARVVLGGSRSTTDFHDVSGGRFYGWYGHVQGMRSNWTGELGRDGTDQRQIANAAFARALVQREVGAHHRVRLAVAPTLAWRTGIDFLDPNPDGRDPANAERNARQIVGGVEHELTEGRIENTSFAKVYSLATDAEQHQAGYTFVRVKSSFLRFGVGDSAMLRLTDELRLKASYEWATRLPSADELFGDGVLVKENLELQPEHSHNANLGVQLERETSSGTWTADVSAFARLADQLIVPTPKDQYVIYENVFAARILGVEGMVGWTTPRGWATVTANGTFQDPRNTSSDGLFGAYNGDRIPNRPWLFASLEGMVRRRDLVRDNDELSLFASSRYVHEFFRSWESQGAHDFKQVVPTQLSHGVGVTYAARGATSLAITVELQNVTDARVYDSYGAQRPGRALSLKLTGEL
ncbi:MAG: TonB-dependent receptor [Kofleriaceae bacterium]|nr:TonB-dependent receptor [Kofleriaceae bacterium]